MLLVIFLFVVVWLIYTYKVERKELNEMFYGEDFEKAKAKFKEAYDKGEVKLDDYMKGMEWKDIERIFGIEWRKECERRYFGE